jgi:sodium/potassium-transporting ATPase subunit alpha
LSSELMNSHAWNWCIRYHSQIVFARTTPDQKLRIVKEFKKRDHLVAVTGDGVNDAPALKEAQAGVAMGSGSDVAIQAADIVLLDSNFRSLLVGIKNGRLVFENLRKVIIYLLPAGSWSELLPILVNVFLGIPLPLSAFLMIYICVITDILPSLSLMYEKAESNLMKNPPRNPKKDKMVNSRLFLHAYLFLGMIESFGAFFMYFYYMDSMHGIKAGDLFLAFDKWTDGYLGRTQQQLSEALAGAQTAYFIGLTFIQFGNLMSTRTRVLSFFQHDPFSAKSRNLWLFGGITGSLALILILIEIPIFQEVFSVRNIEYQFWLMPLAFALLLFCLDEIRKLIVRRHPSVLSCFN